MPDPVPLRVALVTTHAAAGPEAVGLGIGCLAAALRADAALAGPVELALFEEVVDPAGPGAAAAADALAARVRAFAPDLVGLSLHVWNRPVLARVAAAFPRGAGRPFLVAGGPDAGADPERALAELGLDCVVRGEGESAWVEIARALRAGTAAGVGPVVEGRPGAGPSPWLDGSLSPAGRPGVLWELARGCPFACSFCYESRGGRGVRPLPMERVRAELSLFKAAGVRQVFVLDPTFNADRARAREVLALLGREGLGMHWRFEIRAEFLDEAQAEAFARLDCSVQIGLQTADPAVAERVGRRTDPDLIACKVALLNRTGAIFGFDLIYGLPGDSLAGFKRSLDWVLALQPNHLDVFGLSVLPGTLLAEQAAGLGLAWQPGPPYALLSAPGFGADDLAKAAGLARAVGVFYNAGRAVVWFLAFCRAAGGKPARLLGDFAAWLPGWLAAAPGRAEALAGEHPAQRAAEAAQRAFAAGRLAADPELARFVDQMIAVQGAATRAFAEGETTRLELDWDAEALLDAPAGDLKRLARGLPRKPAVVELAPGPDGPRVRRIKAGGAGNGGRPGASRPGTTPRGAGGRR